MKKIVMILIALLCSLTVLSAAETYTIADVNYDIKGSTKPFFLERKIELDKTRTFNSIEEIEIYKESLIQDLNNLRAFENLEVTYTIEENRVTFNIYLDDAWGIIPFGYPKYTTEGGFRVAARLYWNNSLGTLTDTTFQVGVNMGRNEESDEVELFTWDAGLEVSKILLNDRYYDFEYKFSLVRESKDEFKWDFYRSRAAFGTQFDLPMDFTYNPGISVVNQFRYGSVNSKTSSTTISEYKEPINLSFEHSIGTVNVDWKGNFREGYSYGLTNAVSFASDADNNFEPSTNFSLYGNYYNILFQTPSRPILQSLSFATRMNGIFSINNELLGLGDNVRGIESGDLYGNIGFFSSNNLFISVLRIDRLAEAVFGPHFDIGITDKQTKYGAGGDFILYVDKLKSLVARGSITWDVSDFSLGNYNIDITSSLFF